MKHHDKKQLGGGKDLFQSQFQIIIYHRKQGGQELTEAGTWKQELRQKPSRSPAWGLLAMAGLACVLREPKTNTPGMAPSTAGWVFFHRSLLKKMPDTWLYGGIPQLSFPPFRQLQLTSG